MKKVDMRENDYFKQIYNYSVKESRGTVSVNETEVGASINRLDISGEGILFHLLPKKFCKQIASDKLSTSPLHKDADGIVLFELQGEKYVVVCELKSSSGQISSALNQVVSSYLNFCEAFSMCEGFDIGRFHICFILTAKNDGKYKSWLNMVSIKRKTQPLTFYESIIWDNFSDKIHQGCTLSNPALFNLPGCINHTFINNSVSIAFRVDQDVAGVVSFDVNDLF